MFPYTVCVLLVTGHICAHGAGVESTVTGTEPHGAIAHTILAAHTTLSALSDKNTVTATDPQEGIAQTTLSALIDKENASHGLLLDVGSCSSDQAAEYRGDNGTVFGFLGTTIPDSDRLACRWTVSVGDQFYLFVVLEILLDPCDTDITITTSDNLLIDSLHCDWRSKVIVATGNRLHFRLTGSRVGRMTRGLVFRARFQATSESLRHRLRVVHTAPMSGFITSPCFDGQVGNMQVPNARHLIEVPDSHVLLISFPTLDVDFVGDVQIVSPGKSYAWYRPRFTWYSPRVPPKLIDFSVEIMYTGADQQHFARGFKMLFSLHPRAESPSQLVNGRFNCSVPHYASFQQHVHCNLWPECEGGQDEGKHCPFSPPGCGGHVGHGSKCYLVLGYEPFNFQYPEGARKECEALNGSLAMMRTLGEWQSFLSMFRYMGLYQANMLIGLTVFDRPNLYRNALRWLDGTIAYDVNFTYATLRDKDDSWMYLHTQGHFEVSRQRRFFVHGDPQYSAFACQFYAHMNSSSPVHQIKTELPNLNHTTPGMNISRLSLVTCPAGHVTHSLLSCDVKSQCGVTGFPVQCTASGTVIRSGGGGASDSAGKVSEDVDTDPISEDVDRGTIGTDLQGPEPLTGLIWISAVSLFVCDSGERLPYPLVCDFLQHCADGSDEDFCWHSRHCDGFRCRSGQCVGTNRKCDWVTNCVDGSDEENCPGYTHIKLFRQPPPAVVNFHYGGTMTQTPLRPFDACPDTHFRCAGELDYCLPVYVRCNGVYDCLGHEDEADCQNYSCPGFYRCRASSVCVHLDHLCDGWPQCPQRDDELLCDFTCPQDCHCLGLAFICPRSFPANRHPELRYLDASGSGMALHDLASNDYLIWLRLSFCKLSTLSNVSLPNLRTLDLSDNQITSLSLAVFQHLTSLREVRVSGNPLMTFERDTAWLKHGNLKSMDLSHTLLEVLDTALLSGFAKLQLLNASHGQIRQVSKEGFVHIPRLQTLDVRGSWIRDYPSHLFQAMTELRTVYADNYELCCQALLPPHFDRRFCFAPEDEVSSCDDLLRSDVHRIFLWLVAVFSLLGNGGSFLFRSIVQRSSSKSAFNLFVTNLCVADFVMGLYLCLIGTADQLYIGQYILYKSSWTGSTACHTAGFLSLLSSEVSAFMICLITLDRFLVLRFPFSTSLHFKRASAYLACVLAWLLGLLLAALPLLPATSHWQFYGQTGICIPLPITRQVYAGWGYAFGVMIVLNFVLFLLIAAGQASIYCSVRLNSLTTETSKKSQDLTIARRLITVAVSDFLCWFPIGLLGLLAALGVPVPGEFNVLAAIFVLPLNSALNPFLYTYNVLAERSRKVREARLLKLLEAQVADQASVASNLNGLHQAVLGVREDSEASYGGTCDR